MNVRTLNDVRIYNVSVGKTIPEWMAEKKKRSLRYDEDYRRRIELIQGFDFHIAANRVKMSPDGEYIVASGTYPPMVKVFECGQLTQKFERNADADIVQLQVLSDDYGKLVLVETDRNVEFHTRHGVHFKTRVPKAPRDLAYLPQSADLFVSASSPDVYRLNLERGQFLAPFATSMPAVNVIGINPVHQLVVLGGEDGMVECWDPRVKERVGVLAAGKYMHEVGGGDASRGVPEITAARFDAEVTLGLGGSNGMVALWDLRTSHALVSRDHQYDTPVHTVRFLPGHKHVLSACRKVIKVWEREGGAVFTNIEPEAELNDVCVVPESGLILCAEEQPKMEAYFVPQLGPAPKWCTFLDNLTEELEETPQTSIYDDYKFVTKKDLEALGLSHLLGTNLLRAYMHGYFIDMRLYSKAKTVAEPYAYEEYRKQRIKKKLAEKQASRITVRKNLPKVNKKLADKLLTTASHGSKKQASLSKDLLGDSRFSALFTNPEYEINEASADYRRLHTEQKWKDKNAGRVPGEGTDGAAADDDRAILLDPRYELEDDESEPEGKGSDDESSSSSSDEEEEEDEEEAAGGSSSDEGSGVPAAAGRKRKAAAAAAVAPRKGKMRMFGVRSGDAFTTKVARNRASKAALGARAKREAERAAQRETASSTTVVSTGTGGKEIRFVPEDVRRRRRDDAQQRRERAASNKGRRGVHQVNKTLNRAQKFYRRK